MSLKLFLLRPNPQKKHLTDLLSSSRLLTQTVIVHLLRTAKVPVFQRRAAPVLVFTTVGIMIIGLIMPYVPAFQHALGFAQPIRSYLGFLTAEIVIYCIEVQLVKMAYIKIFKTWL